MDLDQIKSDCEDALTLWHRLAVVVDAKQSGILESLRVVAAESPRWCLALIDMIEIEREKAEKEIEEKDKEIDERDEEIGDLEDHIFELKKVSGLVIDAFHDEEKELLPYINLLESVTEEK